MKPEDLDMTEVFGMTVKRKNDLVLVPTPYHGSTVLPLWSNPSPPKRLNDLTFFGNSNAPTNSKFSQIVRYWKADKINPFD
ncbi:hypothetical protein QQP08_020659 [Theobroma cacao]|nr:hypothetical protein QQP08_020659 [Theobroma cacao]